MDKLVEREPGARSSLVAAPALAVQFFLIPLAVVGITVLVYAGFRSLLTDDRTAQDYLTEIRTGGLNRRWPAAYELSRQMADPKVRADRSLAPALEAAYDESEGDPKVRQYLALALGRLDPPLSPRAVASLTKALDDPDSEARLAAIWALGSSADPAVAERLRPLFGSQDAGIRKMVVYALGALPGENQVQTLRTALDDAAPDVRWNAAVALARHDKTDGLPVIRQMLDRTHVQGAVKRDVPAGGDFDPVSDVMISGVRAAAALREQSLRATLEGLSREDRSLKVRQAAIDALKQMESSASN